MIAISYKNLWRQRPHLFKESKPRRWSTKNRFQLSSSLETQNQQFLNRGSYVSRSLNSLISASSLVLSLDWLAHFNISPFFRTIFILGPSHHVKLSGCAVSQV